MNKKLTLREIAIANAKTRGWVIVESRSSKYVVMTNSRTADRLYIGKNGAIRQTRGSHISRLS